MSQDSIQVSTTPPLPGLQLVQQVNAALTSIATDFSGDADPAAEAGALMTWADTASGNLKRRNAANTAWDVIGRVSNRHIPEYDSVPSTDQGGIIYVDGTGFMQWNGTAYVCVIAASQPARLVNLSAKNNATTPASKFDIACDLAVLRNPSTGGVQTFSGVSVTNDTTVAAAANGRDQSGAFSSNQFIHFYLIGNGTSVASISSQAGPATGPTLPSGYTHWAYVGAVFRATSLAAVTQSGSWIHYDVARLSISGGTSTSYTAVNLGTIIPPNSLQYRLQIRQVACSATGAGVYDVSCAVGYRTGLAVATCRISGTAGASSVPVGAGPEITLPNVSQTYYYVLNLTTGSGPSTDHGLVSYQIDNGAV